MGLNPVTTLPYIVHLKSHTCDESQRLRGLHGEHGGTSSNIAELFFPKKKLCFITTALRGLYGPNGGKITHLFFT